MQFIVGKKEGQTFAIRAFELIIIFLTDCPSKLKKNPTTLLHNTVYPMLLFGAPNLDLKDFVQCVDGMANCENK